ncbi:MAG: InlB B-repeat-containing protein [Bacilli bacterium]|nr:InlB B-repeat-containing protein [Bacilli bacterium]
MKAKRFGFLAIGSCAALSLTVGAVFANFFVQDDADEVKVQVRMATINHTVTFQTNGGSSIDSQEVEHNHYATRPQSNPTKDQYVFENWYEDSELHEEFDFEGTPIVEDTTIYAKYNPDYDYNAEVGYRLVGTFDNDSNQYFKYSTAKPSNQSLDGNNVAIFHYELTEGTEFKLIHYNTAGTASDATWYGYSELKSNFATEGYCRDFFEEGNSGNIVVKAGCTGDYTIYLDNSGKIWINRFYTVTYQDGNNVLDTQTVQGGTAISKIADPNKDGYVFKKWCSDPELNNEFNFATLITSDIHLYAKWAATYSVIFHVEGADDPATQVVESGDQAQRPNDPVRSGYRFVNWYREDTFQNVYDFDTPVTENIELHGKWIQTFTVTFIDKVNGSSINTITVDKGSKVTRPDSDPTHTGYDFVNWYADEGCTVPFDFDSTTINANTNIYAKFNQNYDYGAGDKIVLIGNFGNEEAQYYKYSTSLPDEKDVGSGNDAEYLGVALTAGQEVAVKDFSTGTEYGYDCVSIQNLVSPGTAGRIRILVTGTYNFYYKVEDNNHHIYITTNLGGYMVGSGGTSSLTDWTIGTGIASSTPSGTNKAEFLNVSLEAGQEFRILDTTEGSWANKNGLTNSLFEYNGDNIHVKLGGNYSIYVNESYDVSIVTNSTESKTFTASWTEDWVFDGNVVLFAWAWGAATSDAWYSCTRVGDTQAITFTAPGDITQFLLVRCVAGTTTPSWNTTGDNTGRIYNQTDDINITFGTFGYNVSWKGYNPPNNP